MFESRRRTRARARSRGVAVLELTLSLVFLVPLMMAALDFGYYFYVGASAEEAARQGLQQALKQGVACALPPNCGAVTATVTAAASSTGTACVGSDAACYMNNDPLYLGTAANTNISCSCNNAPADPTYTITVQVDFAPAVGYFRLLMPAGAGTKVRYRAVLTGN